MLFQNVKSIFIFYIKKTRLLGSTERNECNSEQNKTLEKEAKRQTNFHRKEKMKKKRIGTLRENGGWWMVDGGWWMVVG